MSPNRSRPGTCALKIVETGAALALMALLPASCRSEAQPAPRDAGGETFELRADAGQSRQTPLEMIKADLSAFLPDSERGPILLHLEEEASATAQRVSRLSKVPAAEIEANIFVNVARNLEEKRQMKGPGGSTFPLSPSEVRRTVVEYECFKLETFATSGVFPKRYFGYFDQKWDTAAYERDLRDTTHSAVAVANEYLRSRKSEVRLSDAEVAVTFIAEGGALLLREQQENLENIHPVYGIGLDDIATGFTKYEDLVVRLDAKLGTRLADIVGWQDGQPYLNRNFRFREAIAGTTLMFVFEKEIAAAKLKKAGRLTISEMSLRDQFIVSSLVYNSGNPHNNERLGMIASFKTADYLSRVSERNKARRAMLNVLPANLSIPELLQLGDYPEQPTSWNAAYHILQRYGAYTALKRFTDVFDDDDMFVGAAN